jgi:predicted ArsR family transcriptional regulator
MQIYICNIGIILRMKPTTRLRILDHFRKYQTASVRELSQFMGMTGANIRHHLAVLEENDLIEIVGQRAEGRGRPRYIYGLSRRVQGDGLDTLAGILLETFLGHATDEVLESSLRTLAAQLAGGVDTGIPIMKRLTRTVLHLNTMHYQARWEASAAGPRLILGHCPYAAIIEFHPELCRMDTYLLQTSLGLPVELVAKLQLSDKGLRFCSFQMSEDL